MVPARAAGPGAPSGAVAENRRLAPDPLLCNRALAAWYLSARAQPGPVPASKHLTAYLCEHDGCRYAVVISDRPRGDVLAVYQVRPDGTLARRCAWPAEIGRY